LIHSSFLLGVGLLVFAATLVNAQTSGSLISTRIAVVDMKRVIEAAPQYTAGKQRVVAELASVEIKLKADEAALAGLKKRRELEAPLMSKAQLDDLVRTIEASERALKRGRDEFNQRLTLRTNEVVRDLERKLGEVIAEVAKSQGADTVISTTATVYTNPRIDITDAVLAKLRAPGN
jgi:outer membrane protein